MAEAVAICGPGGVSFVDPADMLHWGLVESDALSFGLPVSCRVEALVELRAPLVCGPVSVLRSDHDGDGPLHAHAYCHQCEACSDPVAVVPGESREVVHYGALRVWGYAHRCEETACG